MAQSKAKLKPFLKWAGGKTQLIPAIHQALPLGFAQLKNLTYIEPFVGSGAVLFWILKHYPNIEHAVINDINTDLYKAFTVVKNNPKVLIEALAAIQKDYYALNEEKRKAFYQDKKDEFNIRSSDDIVNTVLLIFLNQTCFNGLYRVNSKNKFNVPFGRYVKPKICNVKNLLETSALLQKVTILNGDYNQTLKYANSESFFYFDPPYKPISKTALFNAYATSVFDDAEQKRLKNFCDDLSGKDIKWLLSNSDPKNIDPDDDFFDELYKGDSIYIDRVMAKRKINSSITLRGEIKELLISNYKK
jgi:DNA adenine methylase